MIGIIGAMQIEVDAIKETMSDAHEVSLFGLQTWQGQIANKDVVLALSGVGKVNAAMTTTILATQFELEAVINIGTAGGLLEQQQVLDVVIANKIVQHDYDTSGLDGDKGHGIISYSDPSLVSLCERILSTMDHHVWVGTIASGDTFIHEDKQINLIKKHYQEVIACEMEAGAVSAVCNRLNVKCVIVRSLSDNAHHNDSPMDFVAYAQQASTRSAVFCFKVISELS